MRLGFAGTIGSFLTTIIVTSSTASYRGASYTGIGLEGPNRFVARTYRIEKEEEREIGGLM